MKEFSKKETIDVLETILFTTISVDILKNMYFKDVLPFMEFISYEHKLPFKVKKNSVCFTEYGYKKASTILKNSVQYN